MYYVHLLEYSTIVQVHALRASPPDALLFPNGLIAQQLCPKIPQRYGLSVILYPYSYFAEQICSTEYEKV